MLYDTLQVKDKTVQIFTEDIDPMNPREWDNLGTMVFFHKRYNLGDSDHGFNDPDDLLEYIESENPICLPVYMYDHSGIGLSTSNSYYPFNCPWDSGMLGYILVERDKVKSEYGWKNLTEDRMNKIKSYLQNEVEIYSLYLEGRVYGFISTCNRCNEEDSCWGFYGEDWKENGLIEHNDYFCQCHERAYNQLVVIQE